MSQRSAFEQVALPHLEAAHNLAYWLVRSRPDAEDIVQDAFIRAFRAFAGFRGGDVRPWLLTIVRNVAYRWLAVRKRGSNVVSIEDAFAPRDGDMPGEAWIAADEPSPEAMLIGAQERARVLTALAGLPPAFREVLVLREIEELSYNEIADVIGTPVGTVMSRLARARGELRKRLGALIEKEEKMQCDEAQQLISAGIDGEISDVSAEKVREHTETCASCSGVQADFRRISQQLKSAGREVLPSRLESRVRDAIARTARESYMPALTRKPWLRQVAALAAVCLIAVFGTWTMTRQYDSQARIERDVLAAHMRALLQDNPIQVASSDTHTVKPWFNGRVEFSPEVKDPSAEGFPLAGARLDYIGGKRVAALVYRHRLHVIDVFVWPAATPDDVAPRVISTDGYNLLTWSHGGLTYWAVSDLNATELQQFKALL